MQSFTLAGIAVDGRHSTGLRYSLKEAQLAAALNAFGVPAKLYAGKPEGRIIDLVRQLLRARSDVYLFRVTDETASTIAALAELLQASRQDAVFVFWMHDAEQGRWKRDALQELGLLVVQQTIDGALQALADAGLIPHINTTHQTGVSKSPYLQGLLRREQVSELGLMAKQPWDLLRAELNWVRDGAYGGTEAIPVLADELSEAEILGLAHLLKAEQAADIVELHISSEKLTADVMRGLDETGVRKIRVSDDGGALRIAPTDYGLEVTGRGRSATEILARRMEYGRNGMLALHTGLYEGGNANPGIQHIEVSAEESPAVRTAAYAWAGTQLLLRNAVVVHGPLELLLEEMDNFVSPQTQETEGWPKHSYAIGKESTDGQGKVYFDGDPETEQSLHYVGLRGLAEATSEPGRVTFVSITTTEDIETFEQQLSQFHTLGTIAVSDTRLHFFYENMCRWLANGACSLQQLRRIQVRADQRLVACRDSGEIGSLFDSYDSLLTLVKQRKQLESGRRACEICPVRDECSQCVHLPESWGGRYCEIRIAYPHTALYMRFAQFAQRLRQMTAAGGDGGVIAFSYTGLPPQYYHGPVGTQRPGDRPVLASFKGNHYSWWPQSSRVVRLSEPLACIAEAWWANAAESIVIEELAQRFAVTAEVARENLKEGLALLLNEKVIHA